MIIDPEFRSANLLVPGDDRVQTVNPNLPPSKGFLLPMLYRFRENVSHQFSTTFRPIF